MQDFCEIEAYDVQVAIFGTIAFLVDLNVIREFFRSCLRGLRTGGFLLIDVPNSLDGLVKPWTGITHESFEEDGVCLQRFLHQIPDPLNGTSHYHDTGIAKTSDALRYYQEKYTLRLFSLPLFEMILENVGFRKMSCYCKWEDRKPMQYPAERLILVLEK
jgi:hypothetical protein